MPPAQHRRTGALLQIASSKTYAERPLLRSPELADVFSAITCRIRPPNGTVRLVKAHDSHERIWMPPAPTTVPAPHRDDGDEHEVGSVLEVGVGESEELDRGVLRHFVEVTGDRR
jgi:hypothetical protein